MTVAIRMAFHEDSMRMATMMAKKITMKTLFFATFSIQQ